MDIVITAPKSTPPQAQGAGQEFSRFASDLNAFVVSPRRAMNSLLWTGAIKMQASRQLVARETSSPANEANFCSLERHR
jgi:hypothetical protein